MNLKKQRADALAEAQAIAARAKAAGRDLTDGEVAVIDQKIAEVQELDKQLERAAKSMDAVDRFAEAGAYERKDGGLAGWADDGTEWPALDQSRPTIFQAKVGGEMVARRLMSATGPGGAKALPTTTAQTVPVVIDADPVSQGGRIDTILDIIPAVTTVAPAWTYRRATSREFAAQIVGTGEVKPTAAIQFEDVRNELGVIATVAGPISEQTLQDYPALVRFIQGELLLDIRLRLEDEVFSGTGSDITAADEPGKIVGQHFRGILNTTGVLQQEFTGDGLGAIAVAATRLESDGFTVDGVAMHPTDWVALTTKRNANGGFDLGGAVDAAARTVWGHRVRLTRGLPEGTAVVVTAGSAAIRPHVHGLDVRAVTINDDAIRNQVRIRAEGRFGFDLYRPGGFCAVTLTDDAG
ncbi:HK97 family phage major capsid protein [Brachybacterium sp. AG952]|uniref:phage major capsid protein n=1 Tax=Brachybacterium sp. AG952 TaxID=2183989 RepID=UPI00105BFB22|nr:phage major capsid protein [Brachybacterium sp. AG952]TDP78443.1 HK97 family phage major capsid protein [Brachybacterium sp. AG952]